LRNMSGKFGGGGAKCTICTKTVYPAETIQLEKKPYHVDCFKCTICSKKMEGPSKAATYEDTLYCLNCFKKEGFSQKQKKVVWTKKEPAEGAGSMKSKFGGGGTPCEVCEKTVYPAETLKFEKKTYHQGCFNCTKCEKKGMTPSGAALFEGELMCTKCFTGGGYNRKQASSGAKGGTGATANPLASKFGGGGSKCTICDKTVYAAETLSFEKKPYHAECFKCSECDKKMTSSQGNQFEGKLLCTKCFGDGGYRQKQTKVTGGTGGGTTSAKFSKFGGGGNKCVRCDKTVYPAETVSYEKNFFHSACFTCLNCSKQLSPSGSEGKKLPDGGVEVYCKKCWGELGLNRATVTKAPAAEETEAAAEEVAAE